MSFGKPGGFSFGQPGSVPATGGLFGATPSTTAPTTGFGTTGGFGSAPTTGGFGAPAPGASMGFGSAKPATGGLFGSTAPAAAPAFGQPAASGASTFSFGTPASTAPATTTPSFGGFGAQASTAPATTTPSFGGFGAQGSTAPATTSAAPSFGFSAPASTTPVTTTATPFSFGASATSAALPATTAPSFGAKRSEPSSEPATTASSFSVPSKPTVAATTQPSSSAPSFSFGTPAVPSTNPVTTAALPTTKPTFGAIPVSTASTVPTTIAPVTIPAVPVVTPMLKNKTMEEIVNKWNQDLEHYSNEFHRQAIEVQKWDRAILKNGAMISALLEEVSATEGLQKDIEQNLEYIDAQQNELDQSLNTYLGQIKTLVSNGQLSGSNVSTTGLAQGFKPTHADEDRERAYTLAEHLNKQLDDMSSQLSSVVTEMNASRRMGARGMVGSPENPDETKLLAENEEEDAMATIIRILNEHLSSLEWIDKTASDLGARVNELKRLGGDTKNQTVAAQQVFSSAQGYTPAPLSNAPPVRGSFGVPAPSPTPVTFHRPASVTPSQAPLTSTPFSALKPDANSSFSSFGTPLGKKFLGSSMTTPSPFANRTSNFATPSSSQKWF